MCVFSRAHAICAPFRRSSTQLRLRATEIVNEWRKSKRINNNTNNNNDNKQIHVVARVVLATRYRYWSSVPGERVCQCVVVLIVIVTFIDLTLPTSAPIERAPESEPQNDHSE